ncbi:hypothetical protein CsSME_00017366 [Camellia sinensis var. sinensis]
MKFDTLPIKMQSSNQYSRPAGNMGLSLEVKRSSKSQETSKVVKQKILSPQANQIMKSRDKHKMESPFGQRYLDQQHELKWRTGDRLIFQSNSSKNFQEPLIGKQANKNDELVKHMSNLPGYLQRVEKGENHQENALNFGVLDWERLEKWKYKKPSLARGNTSSGSNSSFKAGGSVTLSTLVQSKSLAPNKKLPPSHHPHVKPSLQGSFSQVVKQSRRKVIQQGFENASRNTTDRQRNPHQTDKSSGRNRSEIKFDRGKRKDSDQKITSEKETSLSGVRKRECSHPSKNKKSAQNSLVTNKVEELQASGYYLDQKHCPVEHKSIILLLPKHSPRKSHSEMVQTSEPRTSVDGKPREANWESFSDGFSGKSFSEVVQTSEPETSLAGKPRESNWESFSDGFSSEEVLSAELCSEIPQSCPLPIGVETSSQLGIMPHSLIHAQSIGLSNDASCTFLFSNETPTIPFEGKCIYENASGVKPSSENGIDNSKRLDHETTEPAAMKGRHSAPNHRFSFSLGRISRSLSFMESSADPQLNSTYPTVKPGLVRSEASDCFSYEEVHSPEITHTCQLPVGVETNTESDKKRHRLTSDQSTELSSDAPCMFTCPNETPNTPSNANAIRASRRLDQESTELESVKGRHPSLNGRFNFSLGRMNRSSSSKAGLTAPQLSSTYATVKSGPVGSEVSDSLDNANRTKASIHSRSRSSPLRRLLLDPLLKARVMNPHHSAETIQSMTASLNWTSEVISSTESLQDKMHDASTVHALLQLTIKNGLPLFKLIVNNNNILIAMKKVTQSGKDDTSSIYTFYSVREIKKSSSWINHGHKGKSCGFGYNIVGQMNIFSSHFPDLTVQISKGQFIMRESVLYGVDLRQADLEIPELVPNMELAAVIVKIPIGDSSDDGDQRNKGKEFSLEDIKGETKKFNSTEVILPVGVHSLPNKGAPSPLIERWKSGGSCDCGGWDVGCKFQILTNEDRSCKLPGPSISCSNPDHFSLFNQGGARGNTPIFSLAPFKKGIYSVEFSASISLLQAFSVCVAVITSQKSFDFSEVNNLCDAKLLRESTLTPAKVQGEVPTKYVFSPPPSPVGRV